MVRTGLGLNATHKGLSRPFTSSLLFYSCIWSYSRDWAFFGGYVEGGGAGQEEQLKNSAIQHRSLYPAVPGVLLQHELGDSQSAQQWLTSRSVSGSRQTPTSDPHDLPKNTALQQHNSPALAVQQQQATKPRPTQPAHISLSNTHTLMNIHIHTGMLICTHTCTRKHAHRHTQSCTQTSTHTPIP